jgi:hypothetical protein
VKVAMDLAPQEQVAANFMARKGYRDIEPDDVEKLDDQPCWYFYYKLDEGTLELEVFWNEKRYVWETMVTTFTLAP